MLTHLIGPLQILLKHTGDHSSILLLCQMALPLELLLERAFQDWNLEINYAEVNTLLREQGQLQLLLQHLGVERRGHLQIEDMGAEVREARMQYFTMNRGLILTSNVFIRILEDDGYLAAWPVGQVSVIL